MNRHSIIEKTGAAEVIRLRQLRIVCISNSLIQLIQSFQARFITAAPGFSYCVEETDVIVEPRCESKTIRETTVKCSTSGVLVKWRFLRAVLAGLLLSITLLHSEPVRRNGDWWQNLTPDEQVLYLRVFSDGMELGNEFAFWTSIDSDSKTKLSSETRLMIIDSYFAMLVKYLSFGQLRDAVSSFYRDYRNRPIEIEKAMWPILEGIAGRPQEQINYEIFVLRQKAAQYE